MPCPGSACARQGRRDRDCPSPEPAPASRSHRRGVGANGHAAIMRQRLADHLIHIIVAITAQTPDEADLGMRIGQSGILLVERRILGPRDGVVWVSVSLRELVADRSLAVNLPSQMLVFSDAGVGHGLGGIVDDRYRLEAALVECFMAKGEAAR